MSQYEKLLLRIPSRVTSMPDSLNNLSLIHI